MKNQIAYQFQVGHILKLKTKILKTQIVTLIIFKIFYKSKTIHNARLQLFL